MFTPLKIFVIFTLSFACFLPEKGHAENEGISNLKPIEAPKPVDLNLDRMLKGDQAADQAIFGMIMAQSQCSQMMARAMQEPKGSKARREMMMLAQMQCQQANQMMAAAKQNKRELPIESKPADMAKLPAFSKFKAPKKPKDEKTLIDSMEPSPGPEGPSNASLFTGTELPESEEIQVSDIDDVINSENQAPDSPSASAPVAAEGPFPADATSPLPPLPAGKLTFDEKEKASQFFAANLGTLRGNSNRRSGGGSFNDDADVEVSADELIDEVFGTGKRQNKRSITGGQGTALTGNTQDGGGGDVSGLFASLLGGEPEGNDFYGDVPAIINLSEKSATDSAVGMNIFQYASYRYRKAAFEEKRFGPLTKAVKQPGNEAKSASNFKEIRKVVQR